MSSGPGTSSNLQMRNNEQIPNDSPVCGYPAIPGNTPIPHYPPPHGHPYAEPHPSSQYHSPPGLPLPNPIIPALDYLATEIIIAVMGVTGAGKSHFIREVSGISDIEVSSNLHSSTTKVRPYSFGYAGAKITLVDTPGFNDTTRSDTDVLREISTWASSSNYREKRLLSGIIYLHRITDVRMDGASLRNLKMFERLCGPSALQNVLLTTTQWANVDQGLGEVRENNLRHGDFWGGLISGGASLERFLGTRESGLELIQKLMGKEPRPLCIQQQMVEEMMALVETDAGKFINEELISLEKRYQESLERIEIERQKAVKEKDEEMKEILVQEQATAREKLEKAVAERELLRAAEMKKSDDEGWGSEGVRALQAVIAVAEEDIPVTTRPYRTIGRSIYDPNDPMEFGKEPFDISIRYKRSIRARLFPCFRASNKEMGARMYIRHEGVRYQHKANRSFEIGSRKFLIFTRA